MRIVAATRVLDEADIIEAFIRHTATFVDHHVLLDNGSRDGTLDIIGALRGEGLAITVLHSGSVSFAEEHANNVLFQNAVRWFGAHWVVFLDADEFIDDRQVPGGLAGLLGDAHLHRPLLSQIKVALTEYVATRADDAAERVVPQRMTWRAERSENFKAIIHARVADAGARIRAGGHGAFWPPAGNEVWPYVIEPVLTHAHYPERSTWQWIAKFVRGWAKVLAAGESEVRRGWSGHYETAFHLLRDHPGAILDDPGLMRFKNERPGLVQDPIAYRGGPLRYTPMIDDRLRAVSGVLGFIEDLAVRHGKLVELSPEARSLSDKLDQPTGSGGKPPAGFGAEPQP